MASSGCESRLRNLFGENDETHENLESHLVRRFLVANWKKPDLRRAIQVAHSQGLVVTGYNINRDGSLSIHTRDCTVSQNGEVTVPPPSEVDDLAGAA
jgi:hypothetical protein